MAENHPIQVSEELIEQWWKSSERDCSFDDRIAFTLAAQWGADQELEACCKWLEQNQGRWEIPASLRAARAVLARWGRPSIEPNGLTDEELIRVYRAASQPARERGEYYVEQVADGLRAVIAADRAHWCRPALTPIPVSERLPTPEDCDAEGRCWVHQPCAASPEAPDWMLMRSKYASANYGATCWLPFYALPLPKGGAA